jgi:hypothetical protein
MAKPKSAGIIIRVLGFPRGFTSRLAATRAGASGAQGLERDAVVGLRGDERAA